VKKKSREICRKFEKYSALNVKINLPSEFKKRICEGFFGIEGDLKEKTNIKMMTLYRTLKGRNNTHKRRRDRR
jgi:hypothetical protein